MSALVPHFRPTLNTSGVRVRNPVTGDDWTTLGGLANWCNGHGGMLIPWSAIGRSVGSGSTETFHFYVGPKARAVERVWVMNLRAGAATGVSAAVTVGGASARTVHPSSSRSGRVGSFVFRESLSAKTSIAGGTTMSVQAIGGSVRVESVCMYEQTRAILDRNSTDYGCDLETLRARQPIIDIANNSARGVADAYKNVDARRAGIYHWSTPTGAALGITSVGFTTLLPLNPPVIGAVPTTGDTTTSLLIAVYAKVNAGSADFRATTVATSGTVTIAVTSTSYAWVTGTLTGVNTHDLTLADGLRGAAFDGITFDARRGTATQLDIAAWSVLRTTSPL
jgi:hypothetical protein